MGKGSRNRQYRITENGTGKKKKKVKKPMPKWVGKTIAIVLAIAAVLGVAAYIVNDAGSIKRSRILLESKSGQYDVNQQMATFIAWQSLYSSAYTYWQYCNYGIYSDDAAKQVLENFKDDPNGYALTAAKLTLEEQLRDGIDDVMESLKIYIAVCDEAAKDPANLDENDKKMIQESIDESLASLKDMQKELGYSNFEQFLKIIIGTGMKEKDVKNALTLVSVYNRFTDKVQNGFEHAVTLADLEAYVNKNPEDFYKIDYISYVAKSTDKAFAEELAACGSVEAFKEKILNKTLDDNYKGVFNKYTTEKTVKNELESLKESGNTGKYLTGQALITAVTNVGGFELKTFNSTDDFAGKDTLKEWLFANDRKIDDVTMVTTDNAIYALVFNSPAANAESVVAYAKEYALESGETYGEDTSFKANIYLHISETKKDNKDNVPDVSDKYTTAGKRAEDLEAQLKADGADITAILTANKAVEKVDVTADTKASTSLPQAVIDAVVYEDRKVGDIVVEKVNDGTAYLIYVTKVTETSSDNKYSFSFVTLEGDPYYQILADLTDTVDDVYPETKNFKYDADGKEGTFEAWISELSDKDNLVSARKEGDGNFFEVKEKDDKGTEVITYNAYMVVGTPMYLDTEMVVKGGYLKFSEKDFATQAKNALDSLAGYTDLDLLNKLADLDSSAKVSHNLKQSDLETEDAGVKNYLFADERKANETTTIVSADGKAHYVVVFSEKAELWKSDAKKAYISEKMEDWVDGLAKEYTPNEKALNKVGKPSPETSTSATTTAAP